MDEELVEKLERAALASDGVFGDAYWIKRALEEIRRLDGLIQRHKAEVHYETYGRKNSALFNPDIR